MGEVAGISKPDTAVMFIAKRSDLRLVKSPRYPERGPDGQKVGEKPGQALRFRDGILRVPPEGLVLEDERVLPTDEALAFLRKHRLFDNVIEGFWELKQAAPPVSQAEIDAMMEATFDEDALLGIIGAEEAGWKRSAVLEPAGQALERLRAAKAQFEAEQVAAAQETPPVAPAAPKRAAKRAAG